MSKALICTALAVCVAAVALTAPQAVRAAEEKAAGKKETMNGKIEAVDVAAGTITIKHKKESKTFTVAPDCKFGGVGNKKVALADLKIGDRVEVTYKQEGDKAVAHHIGHVDVKKKTEEAPAAKQ